MSNILERMCLIECSFNSLDPETWLNSFTHWYIQISMQCREQRNAMYIHEVTIILVINDSYGGIINFGKIYQQKEL